jgi:hypothetical protein
MAPMTNEALARIARVASIIAKDSRQPENVSRAQEILALVEIAKKGLTDG